MNEQQLKVANYESYIENWVHEIKKPLSLMTLLLDNRKDEMSPLVHTRMLYVRDHTRQNVEQILYFSRLGAVHKDYYFEPLPILETCKEAVEDNLSLLEEAHFSVTYSGNNCTAISDKKGFMFILGQIISNSVKYAAHDATPAIHFSVSDNKEIGQIVLSICDNGTGIPASDLPFVFDKGFTGDVGSYLSRSTGMGLYLVQQMASDLTIKIDIHSNTNWRYNRNFDVSKSGASFREVKNAVTEQEKYFSCIARRLVDRFRFIPDYTICLYPYRVYFESNNIRHLPCGDTVSFGDAVSWKNCGKSQRISVYVLGDYLFHPSLKKGSFVLNWCVSLRD